MRPAYANPTGAMVEFSFPEGSSLDFNAPALR